MKPNQKTVYPDSRTLDILGSSATALNQSLDCWGNLIARATSANSKTLTKLEWCLLADTLNGHLHEPSFEDPGELLSASVLSSDQLDELGKKWAIKDVRGLANKLAALDYVHAWAAIISVQWFWRNNKTVEIEEPWWTLTFRRKRREK